MPYPQSVGFADETPLFNSKEFRGFTWGSNLKTRLLQFECKYNHMQNETNCVLRGGSFNFLGVELQNYYYSVNWENEFDYVSMQMKDRQGWRRLKDNLVKELGDQYIGNLAGKYEVYTWQKDDLEIMLRDNNRDLPDAAYLFLIIQNKKFYLERPYQSMASGCSRRPCNIKSDNNCDEKDLEMLGRSLGQCNKPGNHSYNSDADVDKDECITEKDRAIVKKELGTEGYVCN